MFLIFESFDFLAIIPDFRLQSYINYIQIPNIGIQYIYELNSFWFQ